MVKSVCWVEEGGVGAGLQQHHDALGKGGEAHAVCQLEGPLQGNTSKYKSNTREYK